MKPNELMEKLGQFSEKVYLTGGSNVFLILVQICAKLYYFFLKMKRDVIQRVFPKRNVGVDKDEKVVSVMFPI